MAHGSCVEGNLRQFKDSELEATVYHNLRVLLEETDCQTFEMLLHRTVIELKSSSTTASFGKYFETNYAHNKQQWATCYRKETFANTNMYVEAFHRVLKYIYMKGKVNKRLDKCVYVLLKVARDKGFERLVKIEKGKTSERISMIRTRHQTSLKLPHTLVSIGEQDSTWEVQSSDQTSKYCVTLLCNTCPHNCSLRCPDCNICVYQYMCNCADAMMGTTICKHIHLVARLNADSSTSNVRTQDTQDLSLLSNIQETASCCDVQVLKTQLQTDLYALAGQLELVDSRETLKSIRSYITSATNLI